MKIYDWFEGCYKIPFTDGGGRERIVKIVFECDTFQSKNMYEVELI